MTVKFLRGHQTYDVLFEYLNNPTIDGFVLVLESEI